MASRFEMKAVDIMFDAHQELMYMVGVYVNETASRNAQPYPGDILQICGKVRAC